MKPLVDVKDYAAEWYRWSGYVLLIIAAIIFGELTLITPFIAGFWNCLPLSLMLLIAFFSLVFLVKECGFAFKIPLKIYDAGIGIQSIYGLREKFVPFEDINVVEIFDDWRGIYAVRKCRIDTAQGKTITSVENFSGAEKLEEFIEKIKPIFEKKGFRRVLERHGYREMRFRFER